MGLECQSELSNRLNAGVRIVHLREPSLPDLQNIDLCIFDSSIARRRMTFFDQFAVQLSTCGGIVQRRPSNRRHRGNQSLVLPMRVCGAHISGAADNKRPIDIEDHGSDVGKRHQLWNHVSSDGS